MRFHLIDALRGIAAIWVVLFRIRGGFHIDNLAAILPKIVTTIVFGIGNSGVPIFFVISGFVITHSLSHDKVNMNYLARFTLRRSIRLDPAYWASIFLLIFLAWISSVVKNEPMIWATSQTIIAHLFYAQDLLELESINRVYWTLCLEIQFYLLFCILIAIVQYFQKYYKKANFLIFFCVAIISILWPLGLIKQNLYPGLFFPHWHGFLLGVFAYWSWKKKLPAVFFYTYTIPILVVGISIGSKFGIAAALSALFVHEASKLGYISSMNWKWLQFLGMISYSLYLTHNPVIGASFFITYKLIGNSVVAQLIALIIAIITCILFAFLFWWIFEKWSIKLSKKIYIHNRKI